MRSGKPEASRERPNGPDFRSRAEGGTRRKPRWGGRARRRHPRRAHCRHRRRSDLPRAAEIGRRHAACTCCPASSTPRCISASRGSSTRKTSRPAAARAVLGGVTAVFEMPNTKPLTTTAATLADKVARARNRMFCDFAFYVGGTRENIGDIPALERLEGSAGIKVFMGSSTGDLLVDDEASLVAHNRRELRAAPPSTPRTRRASRSAWACAAPAIRHRIPSGATRKRRSLRRTRLVAARRDAQEARARAARVDRRRDGVPCRPQGLGERRGDAAPSDAGRARLLRRARHLRADEPARARGSASPRHLGGAVVAASSTCSAPTTRRTRARRRTTPIPPPIRHDRRADAGADHARSRQRWAAVARALCRPDQRRPAAAVRHPRQGPHRGGLRRRFHHRRPEARARPSPTRGSRAAAAGRPTTAAR